MTGVAFDGQYYPVQTIDEPVGYSEEAYALAEPILLEIELWARLNNRDPDSLLELRGTSFSNCSPHRRPLSCTRAGPGAPVC